MFNYSEMRGIGLGYGRAAFKAAPSLFNTQDYLDAYLRGCKNLKKFTALASDGAMLGFHVGIREATREYWDKSYKSPITSEIWRLVEMYEHPERHGISREYNPHLNKQNPSYFKMLVRWMGEKETYGYSDYREEAIAQSDL